MKTSITIETTQDQEMVIGLEQTGHLYRATRDDVRNHFERYINSGQALLDQKALEILEAAGVKPASEDFETIG